MTNQELDMLAYDKAHILHPYALSNPSSNMTFVKSAKGVYLELEDGRQIIDAMSSWWSVIHGYNVESLNNAAIEQISKMSHVMFGGITHEPAIKLAQTLIEITDKQLERVFFSDSGSVAVEVALKMAFQYWKSQGNSQKTKILAFSKGYHGDTFGAMSACDPITGMHAVFEGVLHKNIFADSPQCAYDATWDERYMDDFKVKLEQHHKEIAAVIIEPIIQGAGGMNIYSPSFLKSLRALCNRYDVLLILDEIATGFGRTGKLFGYEHANISPDILCVGKALTGGYMSLAATLTSKKVMHGVEENGNVLMHGPTFMANPLACAVANASLEMLLHSPWQERIETIQTQLNETLTQCETLSIVKEVRILGAIGVVELNEKVDLDFMTPAFIKEGVWVRPFLNLVYIMPPFIITIEQLACVTSAIFNVIKAYEGYKTKIKKV
ncbi:MAG: adenosylmethionine--8-amino-7-oxononanoate transaminase [Campylobacterota bacterium]|nr:adenosylmethionine--8-amino-7-oxononanoate transaminase [Campylobacterota bacterium]